MCIRDRIDPDLKALQQAVGGNIGASYPFSDPVAIVYNDEGKPVSYTHLDVYKRQLYGYIGCAITLVAIFAIPTNLGQFAQYAWLSLIHISAHGIKTTIRRG